MEEFSHENIACNSCIGDAAEFVCSCSKRRLAGGLLRCLRAGPILSHPRLLRPLRPPLTLPIQRVRLERPLPWLGSGSPRTRSAGARSLAGKLRSGIMFGNNVALLRVVAGPAGHDLPLGWQDSWGA